MVQRTSGEAEFNAGQRTQVRGSGVGNARVDPNKYSTTNDLAVAVDPNRSSDVLLESIVRGADRVIGAKVKQSLAEAYLEGAAKAGTIKSEEELEGNPLTAAWRTAGYRDTMGRVALAEQESRLMEDMPRLREQTPDQFNEYLAKRRAEILPSLEGMSLRQREATFQNLLATDHAAIKKHSSEHAKFQIETKTRSIQTAMRTSISALNAAKSDVKAYGAAQLSTFSLAQSTILDPALTPALHGKLVEEFASFALASDHQGLYHAINEEVVDLPRGGRGTLASLLTWDDSVKLSKQYRESRERTEAFRSMAMMAEQSGIEADWENPDTPLMPWNKVQEFAERATQRGLMKDSQQKAFFDKWHNAQAKKAVLGSLAAAWANGDQAAIISLNKTDEEGLEAWMLKVGRTLPPADLVTALTQIGVAHGRPAALREMGKQLRPALAQLSTSETVDPANAAMVQRVMATLDAAEAKGQTGLFASMMSTYEPEMQSRLLAIREGVKTGLTPDVAIMQANQRALEEAKLTPEQRTAITANNGRDDAAILDELDPVGTMKAWWLKAKSIVSTDAGNQVAITARQSWFENPERAAEANASMKYAVAQELRHLSTVHPFMSKDARKTAALAAVAGRTVETQDGPFILPRGQSLQGFFGVPASTGAQRVGAALDEFVKPAEGNRVVYTVGTRNELMFRELGTKGQLIRSGVLNPKDVAPMVKTQEDRTAEKHRVEHGAGRTKSGYTYNGDNSLGLSNSTMLYVRDRLTESIYTPIDGQPTAEDMKPINQLFMRETDEAVKAAMLPARVTGRNSPEALALFAELNLMTGNKFNQQKEYRNFVMSLKGSDPQAASKALAETSMWKRIENDRRTRLTSMITNVIQGK